MSDRRYDSSVQMHEPPLEVVIGQRISAFEDAMKRGDDEAAKSSFYSLPFHIRDRIWREREYANTIAGMAAVQAPTAATLVTGGPAAIPKAFTMASSAEALRQGAGSFAPGASAGRLASGKENLFDGHIAESRIREQRAASESGFGGFLGRVVKSVPQSWHALGTSNTKNRGFVAGGISDAMQAASGTMERVKMENLAGIAPSARTAKGIAGSVIEAIIAHLSKRYESPVADAAVGLAGESVQSAYTPTYSPEEHAALMRKLYGIYMGYEK